MTPNSHRIAVCEGGVEDVCTELASLKQDARATDEHRRAITDFTTRADGTQARRKSAVEMMMHRIVSALAPAGFQ